MPESSDWKQKYRDSLREMESEEKRWRHIEQALRRLIGRLCAAGMGIDLQLDDELAALAAANRRNADATELESLAESLTMTVRAVDAASPVPTIVIAARWDSTCKAAAKILQSLRSLNADDAVTPDLLSRLTQIRSDAELAAILDKVAGLVHVYGAALALDCVQAAAVLTEVTNRLAEVSGFLAESGMDARYRFEDTVSVNDSVISHVRELTAAVNSATELGVLQTLVNTRLETVTQQVQAFRSREEHRHLEHTGRAERMVARIADLERETQELNSKLDSEKHGARVDPLTRLGNRKSFDERIAHDLSTGSPANLPVTMLLWDLDDFKIINDSYGHRAGDRVLQSVATSFMSALRAEDFVARIGGEEFVMLMAQMPFAKAQQIADDLRGAVESLRFHFRGTPVRITASCGFTDLRPGDTPALAFDRADAALYRAKHGGKNACVAA
ncbi:MAG: diguanylate cyclase [Gammaproteobacteria bacterium]|nr:diguanylate cyclase [Gammaproteobacteria bacterium]